eukprot:1048389-Amphidinium_carterae.1
MPNNGKTPKWETSVFEENSFTFGAFFPSLTAGEMLKVDGGSFRRAEAAQHKAVTLQRLAQHVGFTA